MTTATAPASGLDELLGNALVEQYLHDNPETRGYLHSVLLGNQQSGSALVDRHLAPMIDRIYTRIRDLVDPTILTAAQAKFFIEQLGVFARHNAQFLRTAGTTVEGACPALAQELRRNFLEEGGEPGKVPAHYILYSNALLSDLGLRINGCVPVPATVMLLVVHELMATSHMPGIIAGGYYATEGVAIAETELLREITNRYGALTSEATGADLKALHYYYQLHLDDGHDAAQVDGLSVEAAHIEGLARFIRTSDLFHLDLPQVLEGFLQVLNAMAHWWVQLTIQARELN